MNKQQLFNDLEEAGRLLHNVRHSIINYGDANKDYNKECISRAKALVDNACLLLNEQPEAITDDAHLCKHNVSGSAASENTTTAQTVAGAASSETAVVSGNKQKKKFCAFTELCGFKGPKTKACSYKGFCEFQRAK